MTDYESPKEMEYSDYRDHVEMSAEVALDHYTEYPEDYDDLHHAVWATIDGDRLVTHYVYSLMTVLHSPQNPDSPEYCEPWTTYADLSDPTWGDIVNSMAYVCFYSDVRDKVDREMEGDDDE